MLCACVSRIKTNVSRNDSVLLPKTYSFVTYMIPRHAIKENLTNATTTPTVMNILKHLDQSYRALDSICNATEGKSRQKGSLWSILGIGSYDQFQRVQSRVEVLKSHEQAYHEQMTKTMQFAKSIVRGVAADEEEINIALMGISREIYTLFRTMHMEHTTKIIMAMESLILHGQSDDEVLGGSIFAKLRMQSVTCSDRSVIVQTQKFVYKPTSVSTLGPLFQYNGGYAPLPDRGTLLDPETVYKATVDTICPNSLFASTEQQIDRVTTRAGTLEGGHLTPSCWIPAIPLSGPPTTVDFGLEDETKNLQQLRANMYRPPISTHMPRIPTYNQFAWQDWKVQQAHNFATYLALLLAIVAVCELAYRRAKEKWFNNDQENQQQD